jgi:hypothetical protein
MSGTNGFANATFYLLGSSNATLPLSQWTSLATNVFSTNGSFDVTNTINSGAPQQFFIIQY